MSRLHLPMFDNDGNALPAHLEVETSTLIVALARIDNRSYRVVQYPQVGDRVEPGTPLAQSGDTHGNHVDEEQWVPVRDCKTYCRLPINHEGECSGKACIRPEGHNWVIQPDGFHILCGLCGYER